MKGGGFVLAVGCQCKYLCDNSVPALFLDVTNLLQEQTLPAVSINANISNKCQSSLDGRSHRLSPDMQSFEWDTYKWAS
jgi:hypothetical protein